MLLTVDYRTMIAASTSANDQLNFFLGSAHESNMVTVYFEPVGCDCQQIYSIIFNDQSVGAI